MDKKYVYSFNEGSREIAGILGEKGANLAEMTRMGLPVPFGFTITTEACLKFHEEGSVFDPAVIEEIRVNLIEMEAVMEKGLGDTQAPLLISVRSGAPSPMPGMLDTILNIGLNDEVCSAFAEQTGDAYFVYDSYIRMIEMYSKTVKNIRAERFEKLEKKKKAKAGILSALDLRMLADEYKEVYRGETGEDFPQDTWIQLITSIEALFCSWRERETEWSRSVHKVPEYKGTAVNVQTMVFGNKGAKSATGVVITRNPSTGEKQLYGEFLTDVQGTQIGHGRRKPLPISDMREIFPNNYNKFIQICSVLEKHYEDIQEIEFTIEEDRLYVLQTRNGRRTCQAAVKIASDMVEEGVIDRISAVKRIKPSMVENFIYRGFDEKEERSATRIAIGQPAAPGAVTGRVAMKSEDVEKLKDDGYKVIFIRTETRLDDLLGMHRADGIITALGGATSHAAVVARSMGKACVTGCHNLEVSDDGDSIKFGGRSYHVGDVISLNGSIGNIYDGAIKSVQPEFSAEFEKIMEWADEFRTMKVRANVDTMDSVNHSIRMGADGVGLCRTERMIFNREQLPVMRSIIFARSSAERKKSVKKFLDYEKKDFAELFRAMGSRPVVIRLFDPSIDDVLPKTEAEYRSLSDELDISVEDLCEQSLRLNTVDPLMGYRGCRVDVCYPELASMQTEAIIRAAIEVSDELGRDIEPEILIPFVGIERELETIVEMIRIQADHVIEDMGKDVSYSIGAMIEVPRAALIADELAEHVDFFSFGTNDLTQMIYGFSRSGTDELIELYLDAGIVEKDPFKTIDRKGVGRVMKIAVDLGRRVKPNIHFGICGDHSGDEESVKFCQDLGLHYISCTPDRIPVARMAAAHAAINKMAAEK